MALLSARVARARLTASAQATQKVRELKAAGVDVVSLTQGEPDFATPTHIIEAALAAARAGQTHYTPVDGTPELKAAIAEKFRRDNGIDCSAANISVGAGGKQVLFNALMATLDAGDEVLIPAPSWIAYADITLFCEGVPRWIATRPEDGFKLTPDALAQAITPRCKWLILNSPSNPTGAVYDRTELAALAAVLERHPSLHIISDDIYEHILYDGRVHASLAAVAPQLADRILTVNGASKAYAMTGWRLGYACGPVELIRAMARMQGQSTLNPSSVSQAAALAALTGPQDIVRQRCTELQARRDALMPRLRAIPGLVPSEPHGAFYVYVGCAGWLGKTTPKGRVLATDADVIDHLLESGVAVPGGAGYGMSPYLRVSFATSMATIEEACVRIARAGAGLA
ncbi:MAG: pyridoxal phosphate-dependent aminotransferase [Burkholderiales bacterium]|nr:pyridoxal phosphate-dependent aminotransferase [Burkholderiales bacterium]